MNKKGIGSIQQWVIDTLNAYSDRYIRVLRDDREMSEEICICDDDNDYQTMSKRFLQSLISRGIVKQFEVFEPSIDITITKFKLND